MLFGLKRYGEARASYDKVLALRPDHVEARDNRGIARCKLEHYEETLAIC